MRSVSTAIAGATNSSSQHSLRTAPATTTCGSLLRELQEIWDEIGENESERDKMLLQLEQECLDIYRTKVEKTRKYKADLHQSLAESEAEIAKIASALGEQVPRYEDKGNIKEKISNIQPVLENMRSKKQERMKEFLDTEMQIAQICAEIAGNDQALRPAKIQVNELDLTTKKGLELKLRLQDLQSEKRLRLQKVIGYISAIHDLSVVMSVEFVAILSDIHPSLHDDLNAQPKSISNETLARLTSEVSSLKEMKKQRLQKLQDLGRTLKELWNLMDTPIKEQQRFDHVICLISSSVDEVLSQGSLAIEVIELTEVEVERLNALKSSKLKELIFKRQNELEEIYRSAHMDIDSETSRQILMRLVESGNLADLLSSMDQQIAKAKEQALSRRDILDKLEKWNHASQEENWLDEYERDENRYSAGRGAHINLKRAEKARVLVTKIPSLVENLIGKIKAWEVENGMPFLYDKAPLVRTLEEYTVLRQEKQEEKRRNREQKRLQEQFAAEQEALYGSKSSSKKPLGQSNTALGTPTPINRRGTLSGRHGISAAKERRESAKAGNIIPLNYVALSKDEHISRGS
ncbi:PREDICTED: 65-kDa microtubule-associated protein 5 [Ipomoea nil]|uniref:65-kDa microtubule-associated protein 5 n=1 Tax=Ipomoea nil TaxID=35883 RepID=UPI000901F45D|nr:PREDICTED: 65-kDa microtubule-associated protein 5 [Ipomoea nil]